MSTNVKVIVDQLVDLVLKVSSTVMYPNEDKTIEVYTGNGGYSITVDNPSIAKAAINDKGQIQIESLAPGTATFTVKRQTGQNDRTHRKSEKENGSRQ